MNNQLLPDFSALRIVVFGDLMLDRMVHGDTSRVSPEAPVPVVKVSREEVTLGGAGNVAANLAGLGVATVLVGFLGDDVAGHTFDRLAEDAGLSRQFIRAPDLPSTVKTRVVSRGQQLVRYDHECDPADGFSVCAALNLNQTLIDQLEGADLLLLSDYAKGVLYDPQEIIAAAKARNIAVVVDPKQNPYSIYAGATALTPNSKEFSEAVQGMALMERANLDVQAEAFRRHLQIDMLCLTRGKDGVSLFEADHVPVHVPAVAQEVFDVTGAGDTFAAVFAAGLAAGMPGAEACRVANVAAGLAVTRHGTTAILWAELSRALDDEFHDGRPPILAQHQLAKWAAMQRENSRCIVMTNGCFDVLHPGHWDCLRQARVLGDVLVVAVNSDASVRELKGPSRPVNSIDDRLRMLQGCRDVDALVVFSEPTPAGAIQAVCPDVLVKGGDYVADDVVGADFVRAHGGRVCIVPLRSGYSSSRIIQRLACDG